MKLRQVFEAYSTQVDMLGICWMNREGLRSFAEDAYLGTTDPVTASPLGFDLDAGPVVR